MHPAQATKQTAALLDAGTGWLRGLGVRVDDEMSALAFARLSELAATHQLSVHDAAIVGGRGEKRRWRRSCSARETASTSTGVVEAIVVPVANWPAALAPQAKTRTNTWSLVVAGRTRK